MYNERDRTRRSSRVSMRMCPRQTNQEKLRMEGKTKDDGIITPCSSQTSEREWRSRSGQGEKGYYTVEGDRFVMQTNKDKERFRDGIRESRH